MKSVLISIQPKWCESLDISPFTVYWWIKERGRVYAEQRLSEIA